MAERWVEIEEQIQEQARLIEVENGVERDPIECMELACKRIAEAEAEVDRMADGREETYAELEALGFKSDIQGGPEDSLVRVAKLVRERFYAHERPRIAALEAEVERLRRERAELQSSGLALFRYAQDISHRIKHHKLIDIFPLPQKELEAWVKVLAKGDEARKALKGEA